MRSTTPRSHSVSASEIDAWRDEFDLGVIGFGKADDGARIRIGTEPS
jgi:hypothetical protein